MKDAPRLLLINPWIMDFAAYDFWARPLGLLMLAGVLRSLGFPLDYIDCTDRFHPRSPGRNAPHRQGRGKYHKTPHPKPAGLTHIPRNYSRYGIEASWLEADLHELRPPDIILVTSLMTYWYPGVQETIRVLRRAFPDVPVILGGIYAALCADHALRHSGSDRVLTGSRLDGLLEVITEYTGFRTRLHFDPEDMDAWPYPALDLQHAVPFAPILTSRGCPFHCAYCASRFLEPRLRRRSPEAVMEEILFRHRKQQVRDFVFYDDALLTAPEHHAVPLFEAVIRSGIRIRFHTPNAVHVREIDDELAALLFRAGVKTLRMGLETVRFRDRENLDRKVSEAQFRSAVAALRKAGFEKKQVGAYLLTGLPGQETEDVLASIEAVTSCGVTPIPAYYTPIPHTGLWEAAKACSPYDLEADPIFTNNAIFPCRPEGFSWGLITRLKEMTHRNP